MESAAADKCIPHKSKKRVFPESYSGTESKEEEFSSPVNRNGKGKNKMQKQNEVSILFGTNRTTLKEVIELDIEDSDSSHGKHYIDLSSDDHDSEYESPTSQSHIDTIAHHTGTDSSNSIPLFLESVKMTSSTGMTIPSPSLPGLRTCNHKGVKTSFDNPSGSGEITLEKDSGNNDEVLRKYPNFKKFDIVDDYSDHHYKGEDSESFQPTRTWSKKIQKEWKILENDLPGLFSLASTFKKNVTLFTNFNSTLVIIFTDEIFVRVYESRMDLLRAVIIGAEGTPYHDGLFFFDVFFPNNYPAVPPKVYYHSRGLRINPNLYKDGKVCLSLLNTWIGYKNENWTPGVSTMLQVLVSIQGLILNSKPYFNEPGLDSSGSNSKYGENQSKLYNERTLIYSLKTMGYTMKNPPKHFRDLVIGHFGERGVGILRICRGYVNGGGGFGKDVEKCMGALVGGFKGIGVENLDEFLPQSRSLGQKIREFFGF